MRRTAAALCALILLMCMPALADGAQREELQYAQQFTIDHLEGGCTLLTIAGSDRFLVVPEGCAAPDGLDEDTVVLAQPLDDIYLVATSAMDLIRALDCVDKIRLSGTQESGWYIAEAAQAMQRGDMLYAGKYNAPDFELILDEGCRLAIESTMIYHSPDVMEQLEALGIPVMVERSSYETHPLGRMEWIKFYGALLGREEQARQIFDAQLAALDGVLGNEGAGKTVAFFYINSRGLVNVRKPGDYIARIIELAGGKYALSDALAGEENALSTMNMQMEDFYAAAQDADYIIYNSAIDGTIDSLEQLLQKSELLADFRAVQTGNVYCTEQNLFQESMGLGGLILDINRMLTADDAPHADYAYLYHVD